MDVVLFGLALFFVVGTALPLLGHDHWAVRIFDFPRAQMAAGGALTLIGVLFVWDVARAVEDVLFAALAVSVGYQCYRMYPYTPLAGRQVLDADRADEAARFSILIANVCVENRRAQPLLDLIAEYDPDLVLAVEPDAWWIEQLTVLEADYPHVVLHPQDNAYGMALYARLPLVDPQVRFMVEDDVPSIHTKMRLPSGRLVHLHGMHPRPPHPNHDPDTTERDAELLILAREIEDDDAPTVVAGDLNDVSWSYTTNLFQKISGLLDPRVGRGTYSTFHARYPLLRYPLDHAFHSDHFKLVRLERLPYIGSDHFPVLLELQYENGAPVEQDEPKADAADRAQVQEEIDKLNAKRAATPKRAATRG